MRWFEALLVYAYVVTSPTAADAGDATPEHSPEISATHPTTPATRRIPNLMTQSLHSRLNKTTMPEHTRPRHKFLENGALPPQEYHDRTFQTLGLVSCFRGWVEGDETVIDCEAARLFIAEHVHVLPGLTRLFNESWGTIERSIDGLPVGRLFLTPKPKPRTSVEILMARKESALG